MLASSGSGCVAFVFDAHPRRILGWRAATSMTTPFVLDCLDMALWTRRREGVVGFAGLSHYTDAGSVYTSIAFTDRLIYEDIDASVRSVGDAYDNSLAESQIGLYKSELIHHVGQWRDVDQVEAATRGRLHGRDQRSSRQHPPRLQLVAFSSNAISHRDIDRLETILARGNGSVAVDTPASGDDHRRSARVLADDSPTRPGWMKRPPSRPAGNGARCHVSTISDMITHEVADG